MASKGKPNTVEVVTGIVAPVVEAQGLRLWDVRFEKEGASWYLRVFIDKDGGVNIQDCETVSRACSKLLDEADPIEQSYLFEVCSPGIERELTRPWHFEEFMGSPVNVRLIRPVEGVRDFTGKLCGFEKNTITILIDEDIEMSFEKNEAAYVRICDDALDFGGTSHE